MSTYLDEIVDAHRASAALDNRSLDQLTSTVAGLAPARGFVAAIRAAKQLGVIAEVKRRSPSAGELAPDLDPGVLAEQYREGGATCCSVLTDANFFGGSEADLEAVRHSVELPILRKDFIVSELDVVDTRLMGADCVLLIAAVLDDVELADFHSHRALGLGAELIGVNQRDLETFEVDTERAVRVGSSLPRGVVRVAESGISGPGDIPALVAAGFDSVLVGQSLASHTDPAGGVRALIAAASLGSGDESGSHSA